MAATVTHTIEVRSGRRYHLVVVSETSTSNGDEWSVDNMPSQGTITHYQATLTAGSGSTIAPELGHATGWTVSTQDEIAVQSPAAAHINEATQAPFSSSSQTIYVRSQVDAGSDNTIETAFTVVDGHF